MSLIFFDGFDSNTDTQYMNGLWDVTGSFYPCNVPGYIDGLAAKFGTSELQRDFTASDVLIVGIRVKVFSSAATSGIFFLRDGATTQVSLRIETDGTILLRRFTTTLAQSTTTINDGEWHFLEFKTTINNTTGAYELKINGVSEFSATNVDTQYTANAYANRVVLQSQYHYTDDFYILDDAGSINNDFIGEKHVFTRRPSSDVSVQFTPSSGTDNYAMIDDYLEEDGNNISADGTGEIDRYTFESLPAYVTAISGVSLNMRANKTDAGAKTGRLKLWSGATASNGTTETLTTALTWYNEIYETDPDTTAAWDLTGANAANIGVEVVS